LVILGAWVYEGGKKILGTLWVGARGSRIDIYIRRKAIKRFKLIVEVGELLTFTFEEKV
jgi:hypothetical protein